MDKQQDALLKLGRRLTDLRQRQNLSLAQLSARTGLTGPEIAAIEAGETDPAITTLLTLCRGLGIPPGELLPRE
ncbi:MAG TPA: helix-turn-helix transcriptional regulator [Puia sp.]|nr:helix-turn-helix transcriptional regulator [Puia sp.]